jgi:carboxyl-terminal processing protease
MLRFNRLCLLVVSLLFGAAAVWAAPQAASPEKSVAQAPPIPKTLTTLHPEQKQSIVNQHITSMLDNNHYRQMPINDELSSKVLDAYLKDLDPDKYFFLASDVVEFEKYRYDFDRWLAIGELKIPFEIYNRFQTRLADRIGFALAELKKPLDFTREDTFETDRERASWSKDAAALDELWRKRIIHDALNIKLAEIPKDKKGKKKPEQNYIDVLRKRYEDIKRRAAQTNSEDVFQIYMNAFTESFDPHTQYMSPRNSENFMMHMRLSLQGIGAVLRSENEYTQIVELVPGGPADLSKQLQPDDKIIAVAQGDDKDFMDVVGWRLDDVVDQIRGPKSTVVRLKVIPADAVDPSSVKVVRLVRNKIDLKEQAAKSDVIKLESNKVMHKIGVINIPTFYSDFEGAQKGDENYRSTTRDVRKLIDELKKQSIEGLVIDLRGDGGGSLTEATNLTGLFIKEGPVVQIRYKNGDIQLEADADPGIAYAGPLIVMVDRYSASASEIFAGAIQDYGRGLVVGETTFGKGTVQTLIDLNRSLRDGEDRQRQLKLTTAKFYRVSGASTQHRGVIPDIQFPSSLAEDKAGESAFDSALPWDQIQATRYQTVGNFADVVAELTKRHQQRLNEDPKLRLYQQEVEDIRAARAKTIVSLQETQRIKERDDFSAREKSRRNDMLKLQGMKPLKEGEELPKDYQRPDVLRDEAAYILLDLTKLGQKSAAR